MNSKRRFSMEKLGRDKIEDFFVRQGMTSQVRTLSKDELILALKHKLLEEAEEVFSSPDIENLIEELADLKEVILSLMHFSSISEEVVEEKRLNKKSHSGGFEKGIYFYFVDIPLDCSDLQYFLDRPEKYPEIKVTEEA